jgi:hypothetical protein
MKRFVLQCLLLGLVMCLVSISFSWAQDIQGTWRLVKRELPDGTVQTPPTVLGSYMLKGGQRNLVVFWRTAEGKPASYSVISTYTLNNVEYTETLLVSVFDDGSGNPVVYRTSGDTKTAILLKEGNRVSFQLPFDDPSVIYEGDKLTATLQGAFIDYWERVR